MSRRTVTALGVLAALALVVQVAPAESKPDKDAAWSKLVERIRAVVKTHYPKAVVTQSGKELRMEHDGRDYFVHHQGKGGEWQDAVVERGPRRRGMVLKVHLVPGPYLSQRATGVFDERMYVEHRVVRVDRARGRHLHARLRLPTGWRPIVPKGFVTELTSVLQSFGSDLRSSRR